MYQEKSYKNFIKGQEIQIKKNHAFYNKFNTHKKEIKEWFHNKGKKKHSSRIYPWLLFDCSYQKVLVGGES